MPGKPDPNKAGQLCVCVCLHEVDTGICARVVCVGGIIGLGRVVCVWGGGGVMPSVSPFTLRALLSSITQRLICQRNHNQMMCFRSMQPAHFSAWSQCVTHPVCSRLRR